MKCRLFNTAFLLTWVLVIAGCKKEPIIKNLPVNFITDESGNASLFNYTLLSDNSLVGWRHSIISDNDSIWSNIEMVKYAADGKTLIKNSILNYRPGAAYTRGTPLVTNDALYFPCLEMFSAVAGNLGLLKIDLNLNVVGFKFLEDKVKIPPGNAGLTEVKIDQLSNGDLVFAAGIGIGFDLQENTLINLGSDALDDEIKWVKVLPKEIGYGLRMQDFVATENGKMLFLGTRWWTNGTNGSMLYSIDNNGNVLGSSNPNFAPFWEIVWSQGTFMITNHSDLFFIKEDLTPVLRKTTPARHWNVVKKGDYYYSTLGEQNGDVISFEGIAKYDKDMNLIKTMPLEDGGRGWYSNLLVQKDGTLLLLSSVKNGKQLITSRIVRFNDNLEMLP